MRMSVTVYIALYMRLTWLLRASRTPNMPPAHPTQKVTSMNKNIDLIRLTDNAKYTGCVNISIYSGNVEFQYSRVLHVLVRPCSAMVLRECVDYNIK